MDNVAYSCKQISVKIIFLAFHQNLIPKKLLPIPYTDLQHPSTSMYWTSNFVAELNQWH